MVIQLPQPPRDPRDGLTRTMESLTACESSRVSILHERMDNTGNPALANDPRNFVHTKSGKRRQS